MTTSKSKSEVQILENYRIALTNAENQAEVLEALANFGYGTEEISKGKSLLNDTSVLFDFNKKENNETVASKSIFDVLKTQVRTSYMLVRKKGKVVFRKDPVALDQLELNVAVPRTYAKLVETMTSFYTNLNDNPELLEKMSRLNVTSREVQEALTNIADLEAARADYLKEIGESQDATKAKDMAFEKMDDWMIDFIAVAKIAMEDKPQLLESLGVFVRS